MADLVEERLLDLERLVVRQAERIEHLEEQLNVAILLARQAAMRSAAPKSEAA